MLVVKQIPIKGKKQHVPRDRRPLIIKGLKLNTSTDKRADRTYKPKYTAKYHMYTYHKVTWPKTHLVWNVTKRYQSLHLAFCHYDDE